MRGERIDPPALRRQRRPTSSRTGSRGGRAKQHGYEVHLAGSDGLGVDQRAGRWSAVSRRAIHTRQGPTRLLKGARFAPSPVCATGCGRIWCTTSPSSRSSTAVSRRSGIACRRWSLPWPGSATCLDKPGRARAAAHRRQSGPIASRSLVPNQSDFREPRRPPRFPSLGPGESRPGSRDQGSGRRSLPVSPARRRTDQRTDGGAGEPLALGRGLPILSKPRRW